MVLDGLDDGVLGAKGDDANGIFDRNSDFLIKTTSEVSALVFALLTFCGGKFNNIEVVDIHRCWIISWGFR